MVAMANSGDTRMWGHSVQVSSGPVTVTSINLIAPRLPNTQITAIKGALQNDVYNVHAYRAPGALSGGGGWAGEGYGTLGVRHERHDVLDGDVFVCLPPQRNRTTTRTVRWPR